MAKKVFKKVKLSLPAGKATPAPPVGPIVSPLGINIKQFCDRFNENTKDQAGFVIPVEIVVFTDKTFELNMNQPLMSSLIKHALSIPKGSGAASTESVGTLTKEMVEQIVERKFPDFNTVSKASAKEMVRGSARSMGVKVED